MQQHILNHFKKNDPKLYEIMIRLEPIQLKKTTDYFVKLCDDIISQQLSIKAAATIFNRFAALFPQNNITPKYLLSLADDTIRACGMSYTKVSYVKNLAQKIVDKDVHLDALEKLPDEEVIEELIKVKGIGRWTAEMFLISGLGRENVFSYGDLGVRKGIQRLYGLKKRANA
jgi:DNA-3-methyladenine glycosylase II